MQLDADHRAHGAQASGLEFEVTVTGRMPSPSVGPLVPPDVLHDGFSTPSDGREMDGYSEKVLIAGQWLRAAGRSFGALAAHLPSYHPRGLGCPRPRLHKPSTPCPVDRPDHGAGCHPLEFCILLMLRQRSVMGAPCGHTASKECDKKNVAVLP